MMTVAVLMVVILPRHRLHADRLVQRLAAALHRPRRRAQYLNGELHIGKVSGSLFYGIRMSDIALVQDGETVIALQRS